MGDGQINKTVLVSEIFPEDDLRSSSKNFVRKSNLFNPNENIVARQRKIDWKILFSLYNIQNGMFLRGKLFFTSLASNMGFVVYVIMLGYFFISNIRSYGEIHSVSEYHREFDMDALRKYFGISFPTNETYFHGVEESEEAFSH